jgi:hypothetical protein
MFSGPRFRRGKCIRLWLPCGVRYACVGSGVCIYCFVALGGFVRWVQLDFDIFRTSCLSGEWSWLRGGLRLTDR